MIGEKPASILLIITLLTSVFATANSQVVSGAQEEWTGRIDGKGVINEPEYGLTVDYSVSGDFSFRVLSDNTITGNGVVHITVDWTGNIGIAVCRANESVTISSSVGRIYSPSTNEVSLTFDNSPKSFRIKLYCQSQSSGNLTYYTDIPTYIDAPVFMKLKVGAEYFATQYYPAEDVKIPLKFSIIGGGGGGGGGGGISEAFDFSISVMDTTLTVSPGNSVVTTVTVYLEKGTAQPVTLKVGTAHTELLKTIQVSLSKITGNPNFSSDLTIITSPGTPQGTFTITVVGEGGGITRNKQLTLVVGEGKPSPYPAPSPTPTPTEKPDFTLSVLPKTLVEVTVGESASLEIKVNWLEGSPERVKLNVESNPQIMPWHKISLSPVETQALMQDTSGLTIQTKPNPTKGFIQEVEKYEISITAKSVYSGITKTVTVTLVVKQKCFDPDAPITIDFGPRAKRDVFTEYSKKILEGILKTAKLNSVTITSTARTPADQAGAMFDNLERTGPEAQKKEYGKAGDEIIDLYVAKKKAGKTSPEIKAAMEAKIKEFWEKGQWEGHLSDPMKLNVFDISMDSVCDKEAFEKAVKELGSKVRLRVEPQNEVYHLEITQPEKATGQEPLTGQEPPFDPKADWCGGSDYTKYVPDFDFAQACYQHDRCYGKGGTDADRKQCDIEFYNAIKHKGGFGHALLAWMYYYGVRIGGPSHFAYTDTSKFQCGSTSFEGCDAKLLRGGIHVPLKSDLQILPGDTIKTGDDTVKIRGIISKDGTVQLWKNTAATFIGIEQPTTKSGTKVYEPSPQDPFHLLSVSNPGSPWLFLRAGSGYFKDYRGNMVTPSAYISDVKTEFTVDVDEQGTHITVFDGTVEALDPDGKITSVNANQKLVIPVGHELKPFIKAFDPNSTDKWWLESSLEQKQNALDVLAKQTSTVSTTSSSEGGGITLNTNKDVFSVDDLVQITGNVPDSPSQLIGIEVKDPDGNTILVRTVQADANGNFALVFKIPPSAKTGKFDIIANGEVEGVSATKIITVSTSQEPEVFFVIIAAIVIFFGIIAAIVIGIYFTVKKIRNWKRQKISLKDIEIGKSEGQAMVNTALDASVKTIKQEESTGINPGLVAFNATDIDTAYKKALIRLSEFPNSNISEKEPNVYIKAKTGSHLKARIKGFAMCDLRDLPTEVLIDFVNKRITVKDVTGPGVKWGAAGRISRNMTEIADELRQSIEGNK